MPFTLPANTKFAAIHFRQCATSDDVPVSMELGASGSLALTGSCIPLLQGDKDSFGKERARDFEDANFVLFVWCETQRPWDRDAEWRELEQRLLRLYYAVLMHGVPSWWSATLVQGGCVTAGAPVILTSSLLWETRHPFAKKQRVTMARLVAAADVAASLGEIRETKGEWPRIGRGVYRLTRGWRENESMTDRLHEFVRALDSVMVLREGSGRADFIERFGTFAKGAKCVYIAHEIYLLRNHNEHLTDWPGELEYVKPKDRERFVIERTHQVELVASLAYQRILHDRVLRASFRNDTAIAGFWADPIRPLADAVDLDRVAREEDYTTLW